MRQFLKLCIVVSLAAALGYPIATWALSAMHAANGLPGAPLALADSPLAPAGRALLAALAFAILAILAGRLTDRSSGLLTFGILLLLIAHRTAPIRELLQFIDDAGRSPSATWLLLALESLFWSLPAALAVYGVLRFAPPDHEPHPGEPESPARSAVSLRGFAVALLLAAVLAWVMLRTNLKGQSIGGTLAALALAVMIVRILWPTVCSGLLAALPTALALICTLSSVILIGSDPLLRLAEGSLWPLARPAPLDLIGAGFVGVAFGIKLARGFAAEHAPRKPADSPGKPAAPAAQPPTDDPFGLRTGSSS